MRAHSENCVHELRSYTCWNIGLLVWFCLFIGAFPFLVIAFQHGQPNHTILDSSSVNVTLYVGPVFHSDHPVWLGHYSYVTTNNNIIMRLCFYDTDEKVTCNHPFRLCAYEGSFYCVTCRGDRHHIQNLTMAAKRIGVGIILMMMSFLVRHLMNDHCFPFDVKDHNN